MGRGMREFLNGIGWVVAVCGAATLGAVGLCGAFNVFDASIMAAGLVGAGLMLGGGALAVLVRRQPSRPPEGDDAP